MVPYNPKSQAYESILYGLRHCFKRLLAGSIGKATLDYEQDLAFATLTTTQLAS
jgi:hypothetical protein